MCAGLPADDAESLFGGEALLMHQRIKHVRHGHTAGRQRDLLTLDASEIALTFPAPMVIDGQLPGLVEIAEGDVGHLLDDAVNDLAAAVL